LLTKIFKFTLGRLDEIISGLFLGVMSILIFVQVLNRYFFQYPVDWLEELARYVFIWATYIGFSVVTSEDRHLEVKFIRELVGDNGRRWIQIISYIITIIFCLYVTIHSGKMAYQMFQFGETSASLQIPMAFIYASIPVGIGLMGVKSLLKLQNLIFNKR